MREYFKEAMDLILLWMALGLVVIAFVMGIGVGCETMSSNPGILHECLESSFQGLPFIGPLFQ